MKKSLIALAAFAAVGVASAQVSVYGKLDMGLSKTTGESATGRLSGYENSRLGFKASQKVGDVTVSAVLEGGLSDDNGDPGFSGFNRVATVDVSGSFGSITMGTQWTPFDNAVWTTDATAYNKFTPLKGLKAAWNYDVGNTGNGNAAKSFQYTTPDMNGFQAMVLSAPKHAYTDSDDVKHDTKYSGFGLNYAKGPLTINFATQSLTDTAAKKNTANVFAVQYDLGVATVSGGVVNGKQDGKDRGYIVGVSVPLGADSVSLAYSTNKHTETGKNSTSNGLGGQYVKSLNKSAVAYVGFQRIKTTKTETRTGLGVSYRF